MMQYFDDIHGTLQLPDYVAKIIQTPQFTRLKAIKQLGFLYLTTPKATYTRYQHCIGTYWVAKKMLSALLHNSKWLGNDIDYPFYRTAVEIAALLHDIGHGPFSHSWEVIANNYDHEANSRACVISIFDQFKENDKILHKFNENNRYGVELIIALIQGEKEKFPFKFPSKFNFLFEIVHNKKCKVDVDKWDYLIRDRFYLQEFCNPNINFEVAFLEARPAEDGSCIEYRYEDFDKLYQIFHVRWQFHHKVYSLPLQLAVEKLMKSIMNRCKEATILSLALCDITASSMPAFLELTDENVCKLIQSDPDYKCLENPKLLKPVNLDDITDNDRVIVICYKLVGAGLEMPSTSSFSFFGDKSKKSNVIKDYSIYEHKYFFRIDTD